MTLSFHGSENLYSGLLDYDNVADTQKNTAQNILV